MSKLEIRELKDIDSSMIDSIVDRNARRWGQTQEYFRATYITPSFHSGFPFVFVALWEGRHAGEVLLVVEEKGYLDINGQVWITALYVKPEFRCRGVGRALVRVTQEKCREYNFSSLYLDTAFTKEYYLVLGGWKVVGDAWWKQGNRPTTVMEFQLAKPSS